MADEEVVRKILGHLGETAGRATNRNGKIASNFLDSLLNLLCDETGILKGATFMHAGSAYEGLSVNEEADFDIPLILTGPNRAFLGRNFEIHREQENKLFKLKWRLNCNSEYRYQYNIDGYLNCKDLLSDAFERLEYLITDRLSGWRVKHRRGLNALVLEIIDSDSSIKISMDLVPQIAFRSWECPDLVPLNRLPEALQRCVIHLQSNGSPIFFAALAVPREVRAELCNFSFHTLEKELLIKEVNARDIVRLVKLIGACRNWKKTYHIKSFQLKRLAIKHVETLKNSRKWDGVKLLLNYIFNDLQDNTIEGFFLKNQVIYKGRPTKVGDLKREIIEVRKWSAADLKEEFDKREKHANKTVATPRSGHIDVSTSYRDDTRQKDWPASPNSGTMMAHDQSNERGCSIL